MRESSQLLLQVATDTGCRLLKQPTVCVTTHAAHFPPNTAPSGIAFDPFNLSIFFHYFVLQKEIKPRIGLTYWARHLSSQLHAIISLLIITTEKIHFIMDYCELSRSPHLALESAKFC